MNDDLLKMLGLDQKPAKATKEVVADEFWEPMTQELPKTVESVLKTDEWDWAQGARLAIQPGIHRALNARVGEDITTEMTDFFAAAFHQRPESADGICVDARRQQFIETLLETPDYKVLHATTMSNVLASDMAAVQFARQFADLAGKEEKKGTDPGDYIACIGAVSKALKEAQAEVDELQGMQAAIGMGAGTSGNVNSRAVAALFNKVRNSSRLRKICELAGRYRLCAQAKQRQKVRHGNDEVIGVELAGDVGRLVPSELAMLADPLFELDAMRRLVEKQSMCREYRGVEKVAKGPIIVCVDESGSMAMHEKIENAKALALSMAWIAQHQNRDCLLASFSGSTQSYWCELKANKWDQEKLLEWLEHFFGGGTDMDVPFVEVCKHGRVNFSKKGKADMVVVTDGVCRIPDDMASSFNKWKQENRVRCVGIVIGGHSTGELNKCCDEVHTVSAISVAEDVVQQAFSV